MFYRMTTWLIGTVTVGMFGSGLWAGDIPDADLYRITSGTFTEVGGFAGEVTFNLPGMQQEFIELRIDPQLNTAEMRILNEALEPYAFFGFEPLIAEGVIAGGQIRFLDDTLVSDFDARGTLDYIVTTRDELLMLSGSLISTPVCCDIPSSFFHTTVQASRVHEESVVGLIGDCNLDGVLDVADLDCVATIEERDAVLTSLHTLAGDLNGNGDVDFADFSVLSSGFGDVTKTLYTDGNIDLENGVAFADFLVLSANFGRSATVVAAVPEPSTMLLLVVGLAGFVRRRSIASELGGPRRPEIFETRRRPKVLGGVDPTARSSQ